MPELLGRNARLEVLYQGTKQGWAVPTALLTSLSPQARTIHLVQCPGQDLRGAVVNGSFTSSAFSADAGAFLFAIAAQGKATKWTIGASQNYAKNLGTEHVAFGGGHDLLINPKQKTLSMKAHSFHNTPARPALSGTPMTEYWVCKVLDTNVLPRPAVEPETEAQLQLRVERLRSSIRSWDPSEAAPDDVDVKAAHILLVGRCGAGKSAFLNSLATAIRGRQTILAETRPSDDHVTRSISVKSLQKRCKVQATLVDIPGWDEETPWPTYQRLVRCVVRGQATPDDVVFPLSETTLQDMEERNSAPFEQRIHCILVLRPAREASKLTDAHVKDLVEEYTSRAPVLVLLSKADEAVDAEAQADLRLVSTDPSLEESSEQARKAINVDPQNVLPIVNYVATSQYPEPTVEAMAMAVLERALAMSEFAYDVWGNHLERQRRLKRQKASTLTPGQP